MPLLGSLKPMPPERDAYQPAKIVKKDDMEGKACGAAFPNAPNW